MYIGPDHINDYEVWAGLSLVQPDYQTDGWNGAGVVVDETSYGWKLISEET